MNVFASNTNTWKTYIDTDSIKIEYSHMECQNSFIEEFITLKVTNKLNTEIIIEWKEELWYDDNCINCEQNDVESRKKIKLKPGEIAEGECNINSNLKIFSKFKGDIKTLPIIGVEKIATLSDFQLKNITIK